VLREHTRETTETCALLECTRDTQGKHWETLTAELATPAQPIPDKDSTMQNAAREYMVLSSHNSIVRVEEVDCKRQSMKLKSVLEMRPRTWTAHDESGDESVASKKVDDAKNGVTTNQEAPPREECTRRRCWSRRGPNARRRKLLDAQSRVWNDIHEKPDALDATLLIRSANFADLCSIVPVCVKEAVRHAAHPEPRAQLRCSVGVKQLQASEIQRCCFTDILKPSVEERQLINHAAPEASPLLTREAFPLLTHLPRLLIPFQQAIGFRSG